MTAITAIIKGRYGCHGRHGRWRAQRLITVLASVHFICYAYSDSTSTRTAAPSDADEFADVWLVSGWQASGKSTLARTLQQLAVLGMTIAELLAEWNMDSHTREYKRVTELAAMDIAGYFHHASKMAVGADPEAELVIWDGAVREASSAGHVQRGIAAVVVAGVVAGVFAHVSLLLLRPLHVQPPQRCI